MRARAEHAQFGAILYFLKKFCAIFKKNLHFQKTFLPKNYRLFSKIDDSNILWELGLI